MAAVCTLLTRMLMMLAHCCRYIDREGEMRQARPPVGRAPSLLPAAAQVAEQQAGDSAEAAAQQQ